jgi:cytochrome P450
MIFLNDISLHSTALMAQNLLFDLFHSDPSMGYVDLLRAEASSALAAAGGTWTRPAVMQLKLIDSTIRESMRLHPFASIGLPRTVVHPNGIMLQEDGVRIPQGTLLAVPLEPVHYDEALYPNPMAFQPLRFADPENIRGLMDALNPGEAGEACNTYAAGEEAGAKKAKQGVTLDDAFLGFGYGRHACPGRFFAMNEVKVFVAHVLLNYEIEYNPVRPKPIDAIWLKLPLHGGKLKVRRRREGRS